MKKSFNVLSILLLAALAFVTVGGKAYRVEREVAERYKDLWEKSAK